MDNYQLYSTNILLGGNMKFDFILDKYIKNIVITPLSEKVPYNYMIDNNIKNQSMIYNIRNFYNESSGYFYDDCVSNILKSDWPLIQNAKVKPYDDTIMMGCKHVQNKYHNKKFELFAPIWIYDKPKNIDINIIIKDDNIIISNKKINIYNSSEKNDVNNYLNDYFTTIFKTDINDNNNDNNDDNNNNLINIDFINNISTVCGLDVTSGQVIVKNNINLLKNLTDCIRPVMETDSFLCKSFSDNKLIARNLFNLNLCFDINDVLEKDIFIKNTNYTISCDIYINGEKLIKKDFYNNYKYLPRNIIYINSNLISENNILSTDDRYIELKNKNKIIQNYFHWGVIDFPNYIFNINPQFGGIFMYDNNETYYEKYTGISGDLLNINKFIPWTKVEDWREDNILFKYNQFLLNQIKAVSVKNYNPGIIYQKNSDISALIILVPDSYMDGYSFSKNLPTENRYVIKDGNNVLYYYIIFNDQIFLFTNDLNNVSCQKILNNEINDKSYEELRDLFKSYIYPNVINVNNNITALPASGPINDIDEIEYYKVDLPIKLLRYTGRLTPYFIDIKEGQSDNIIYYKKYIDDESFQKQYMRYKFNPLYESIGYYSFGYIDNIYENLSLVNTSSEFKWYNKSQIKLI